MRIENSDNPGSLAIVVLGDLAHSTRMLNHTRAALDAGLSVTLIGHHETELPAKLLARPKLRVLALPAWRPAGRQRWPRALYLLYLPLRMVGDAWGLIQTLRRVSATSVLIQTPPALPGLLIVRLLTRLRGQTLLIDWHNLGYTITGLQLGQGHPLTKLSAWLERCSAKSRRARHLAVTQALAGFLREDWEFSNVQVLRDAPPPAVPRLAAREEHLRGVPALTDIAGVDSPVVLCPSGWTVDDDLNLALQLLPLLDAALLQRRRTMRLVFSGTGPRRQAFAGRLTSLSLRALTVRLVWVPLSDYPALLACADIGLCLHRSASGLDLPIKVFELYAAGANPILALAAGGPFAEIQLPGLRCFDSAEQLRDLLLDAKPKPRATAPPRIRASFAEWRQRMPLLLE